MNRRVLLRFVKLMAIATGVMFTLWVGWHYLTPGQPGDYYVREGSNRLGEGDFTGALESFEMALAERADHRGALMGRAIAFLQAGRHPEAEAELTYLIGFLERTLEADDLTGRAVLAAAHANRGILYDRTGRHEMALDDYIEALKVDQEAVSGPGLIDNILYYNVDPATVRGRALYLKKQFELPQEQRQLTNPELDKEQRMYKP